MNDDDCNVVEPKLKNRSDRADSVVSYDSLQLVTKSDLAGEIEGRTR